MCRRKKDEVRGQNYNRQGKDSEEMKGMCVLRDGKPNPVWRLRFHTRKTQGRPDTKAAGDTPLPEVGGRPWTLERQVLYLWRAGRGAGSFPCPPSSGTRPSG